MLYLINYHNLLSDGTEVISAPSVLRAGTLEQAQQFCITNSLPHSVAKIIGPVDKKEAAFVERFVKDSIIKSEKMNDKFNNILKKCIERNKKISLKRKINSL